MANPYAKHILKSRHALTAGLPKVSRSSDAAEGGCGVLGVASTIPIAGRHVLSASRQMHNRGNGKGGGIAMAGLDPEQMHVDTDTLRTHYILQIALLDPSVRNDVEHSHIHPYFDIAQSYPVDHIYDYRVIDGLEVCPPDVWRYFVRVKPEVLKKFATEQGLHTLKPRALEDEFVYQNTFKLNQHYYASLGEKRAFVLSHARDLIVLKIVGYAEQVVEYYQLEDQTAQIWIAHQRYPTKGRVWHPGGAHPFIGMNEALVHNGDFANYHAVSEYLLQRHIVPLFLTDTEVSALLFDLWDRVYGYPLEVTLEAMAPTTEHDFMMLPAQKQDLYRTVQAAHIHASPDGPWFFILARSHADENSRELLGITDTSMLRPQVFALYENAKPAKGRPVQIGLIASERQAINACLRSLAEEDDRFEPVADRYWVARGGSHTDGGSFRFVVSDDGLVCLNKFGAPVQLNQRSQPASPTPLEADSISSNFRLEWQQTARKASMNGGASSFWKWLDPAMPVVECDEVVWGLHWLNDYANENDCNWQFALNTLTLLRDKHYALGNKKRAALVAMVDDAINRLLNAVPAFGEKPSHLYTMRRLTWETRHDLRPSHNEEQILVLDTLNFPPEGDECAAHWLVQAYELGWTRFIAYNWRGGRFAGCGFGTDTYNVRLDLYGDSGDYAASGLDGMEIHIHGDAQDQVAQIMRRGKLVVHGDVGQTFLYGAKGGDIYVKGSAAGRPLINAVGKPRAVINGTCLDYLAESFMAGDPLDGGGFVILNGVTFAEDGSLCDLESPYPGGNLFSLASGGAIYLRDPDGKVDESQLNGGVFAELCDADWKLIEPYLRENERLFGIKVSDLLTINGRQYSPAKIYRKVEVRAVKLLQEAENR